MPFRWWCVGCVWLASGPCPLSHAWCRLVGYWKTQTASLMSRRMTAVPHAVMVMPVAMLVRMSLNRLGLWFISVLFDGVFARVFLALVLAFDAVDELLRLTVGAATGQTPRIVGAHVFEPSVGGVVGDGDVIADVGFGDGDLVGVFHACHWGSSGTSRSSMQVRNLLSSRTSCQAISCSRESAKRILHWPAGVTPIMSVSCCSVSISMHCLALIASTPCRLRRHAPNRRRCRRWRSARCR
nr:MAG TPA: hypothetical protein [Caudoviricetes sp.]